MKYRKLGRSKLEVSEIGLGTSQLANTTGSVAGAKHVPKQTALRVLEKAIEAGINFFDTADSYGDAESLIGSLPSSLKTKLIVATKAGWVEGTTRCFTRKYLSQQVEASLRALKIEAIDLFLLNKPSLKEIEENEVYETLSLLKKQGKIRLSGFGVGSSDVGERVVDDGIADAIMVLYHLLYTETHSLIEQAHRKGIGVIVRSPFCSGILSGKMKKDQTFDVNDSRRDYFSQELLSERLDLVATVQSEFDISNSELLQFALKFILSHPGVSSVIPGPSAIEQVSELATSAKLPLLTSQESERIRTFVKERSKNLRHRFQL